MDSVLLPEIDFITRLLFQHLNDIRWKFDLKSLHFKLIVFDSPVIELFRKLLLIVFIVEFWIHSSVIPQVVDQYLEGFSISIKEDASLVHFGQVMHS